MLKASHLLKIGLGCFLAIPLAWAASAMGAGAIFAKLASFFVFLTAFVVIVSSVANWLGFVENDIEN